uniref:KIB1-4 beta-propeller domain-containing protein n=1 Tax=Setaria italica TaxID=4555 RepID=K3ZNK6_SETIT
MDSGAGTSADHTQHAPLPVCVRKGSKASQSLATAAAAAAAQTRCSTKCAPASETRRSDEAQEAQNRPCAGLPEDILGVVVGRLPLVEERAKLLSPPPPPPLPPLLLYDFSFASFCAEGTLTGPERETESAGSVRCMGSFEGWLVGVKLNKGSLRCFLMKAFSRDVVRPPPPSAGARHVDAYSWSLPIVNGSGVVNCAINATVCVAVGISIIKSAAKLAFWQSGMKSWCISSEFTIDVFAFEISEDNIGMIVSRVERFIFELPESGVENLIIVATYSGGTEYGHMIDETRIFEADLSTNPVRFTEIQNLDGDCIFISPCSSKSFRSCHDGVGEDLIYFIDGNLCPEKFVYSMKDGTMAPVAAHGSEDKFWAADAVCDMVIFS